MNKSKIIVVDYGIGNIPSILNMLQYIGVQAQSESDPTKILKADKLILPGVGAYDAAMGRINEIKELKETLNYMALQKRTAILGICLGMQLMVTKSEEGNLQGFNWVEGNVKKFPNLASIKTPHMGWNSATISNSNELIKNFQSKMSFYFVHSYYLQVRNESHSILRTHHGIDFDSAFASENIYGVQFHPEKSRKFGMQLLRNFSEL